MWKKIVKSFGFISRIQAYVAKDGDRFYLLLSLFIAVLFAPWTEQRYDNYVSRLWPALITRYNLYPLGGQLYTFGSQLPPNGFPAILGYAYPPIWLYISLPIFSLWQSITKYSLPQDPSNLWINGIRVNNIFESYRSFVPSTLPLLDLLLKLPSILSFVGICYLLLKLAKEGGQRKEVLFLWILNPYVIQIVAIWGSFDALVVLFAFTSLYLLHIKRNIISAASLSLGFCTKIFPILFLLPSIIFVWRKEGLRESVKYLCGFFLTASAVFGSFILLFPKGLEFLFSLFIGRASPDMYGTTFIAGITWLHVLSPFVGKGNFPIFPLIFVPVYFIIIYIFWARMLETKSLYMIFASILFLFYLSYTVINPQYFLWCLPFLVFLVLKRAVSKRSYLVISFIPLVWMYFQYNVLYFISPILVWNEGDFPPWSYITTQLNSPAVVSSAEVLLTVSISVYIFFLLSSYLKGELKFARKKPRSSQEFS